MSTNKLKRVNDNTKNRKTQTPDAIKKLFFPVNNMTLNETDDSDHSELSDKYHDLNKADCHLKTYKNQSVLDEFTEEYKDTAMELRQELQVSINRK